tara:strand:+ start:465 stop:677 length:213 start_codon:yes stop_codon:yes gene_type:complete
MGRMKQMFIEHEEKMFEATMQECPECRGAGNVEVDHYHRQSFDVPYGDIYTTNEVCDNCSGEGVIEGEEQ